MNILENLCYYDRRNPNFSITKENGYDEDEILETGDFAKKDCGCDNCFYGRAKLVEFFIFNKNINRIEIINHNSIKSDNNKGRVYTNYNVKSLELSYQDNNKTLKIFI